MRAHGCLGAALMVLTAVLVARADNKPPPGTLHVRGHLACAAFDPPRETWSQAGAHPVHQCELVPAPAPAQASVPGPAPAELPRRIRLRHVGRLWHVAITLDGHLADFELLRPSPDADSDMRGGGGGEDDDPELSELADLVGRPRAELRAEAFDVVRWTAVEGDEGADAGRRRRTILSGARSTVLVRVTFGDGQGPSYCDQACARAAMWGTGDSVDTVMARASSGAVSFPSSKGKVMDVRLGKSPGNYQGCDTAGYAADAAAAAKLQGVVLDRYDHQVFYIADITQCPGWGGIGDVGGSRTFLKFKGWKTLLHELGHNIGMLHSKTPCKEYAPLPPLPLRTRVCPHTHTRTRRERERERARERERESRTHHWQALY